MLYSVIADLQSHKILSTHEIVELMIQEYLSQIDESMISEEMTHNEIQFVHLTMMNTHNLFNFLKRNPEYDLSFLGKYTEDEELNTKILETMSLIKELQSKYENFDSITLVAPIDFEDHIRNLERPSSLALDTHINWAAVAQEKRNDYVEIDLSYKEIGISGTWMKLK